MPFTESCVVSSENHILSKESSFRTDPQPRDSSETTVSPDFVQVDKPILILDINIGGAEKQIVALEIYE